MPPPRSPRRSRSNRFSTRVRSPTMSRCARASAATPAEIAAIRRRYLLMAVSAAGVDIAFNLVFVALNGAWSFAPRSVGAGLLLLGAIKLVLCMRLFAPIERYLKSETSFEDTQRRITQLPLLTARYVAILELAVTIFRLGSSYFLNDPAITGVPQPTLAQDR